MRDFLWKMGESSCHLIPDRCLFIQGEQMPLCSRCFSWYIAALFTTMLIIVWQLRKKRKFYFSFAANVAIVLGMFVLVADGFTQLWGWRLSNNPLRIFSGLLFGVCSILLAVSVYSFHKKGAERWGVRRALFLIFLGMVGSLAILLLNYFPVLGIEIMYLLTLLAHAGGLVTAALALGILGVILFKKVER